MKSLLFLGSLVLLFSCSEKHSSEKKIEKFEDEDSTQIKSVSSFFPKEKTKVLVVGTFHFDYPGLDDHKTKDENKIDVLLEPKKTQVTELVNYIKTFNPNKIALEANKGWNATEKLRAYKSGGLRDKRDERYQLGMRIASELNLDTLYEVNAYSLLDDFQKSDSLMVNKMIGDVNWEIEDPYWPYVERWFEYDDQLVSKVHLIDYMKQLNAEEAHQYGYGIYLLGSFKSENNQGADNLSIWWYNRNLRIFRNIQGITAGPEDRILVIMGNGHAAILRQLFESSPEYEFVEFDSL